MRRVERRIGAAIALALGGLGATVFGGGGIEIAAGVISLVAAAIGFVWTWRRHRLEMRVLQEQLHDQLKDGDNAEDKI